ncbi:MAG: hypothetical protein ACE5KW_01905, partial [Dehalococcoidia bacterium]
MGVEALPVTVSGIASRVVLDRKQGTATKVYRRHFLVRLLYWLAFQAPFPYRSNRAALKAAQYRRRIASLITKFVLGRDIVAPVLEVRPEGDGYAFVTGYVNGTKPRDKQRARQFLGRITEAFIQVGLPTWQVTPHNPRAVGNLIETEDGDYRIIDLESNVVTPMVPLSGLWGAAREAHLPAFDDVDVPRLRTFVCEHRTELGTTLGERDFRALQKAVDRYAWYERRWHDGEPRLWGRLARFVARALDVPAHIRGLKERARGGQEMAEGFIHRGIDDWEREGHLTARQTSMLRAALTKPEVASVLVHLGAHMAISVPLRFPVGSIARSLWTLGFRAKLEVRALRGHRANGARAVHSLPVALLAAVPGVGTFAYLLAKPLRSNRALAVIALDRMLRKLPFRLYQRMHLSALTTWLARPKSSSHRPRGRSRRPRLGEVAAAAGTRLAGLAPDRRLIASVLALNAAVLIAASAYDFFSGRSLLLNERGLVPTTDALQLLAAGILGQLAFLRFWQRPRVSDRGEAAGIFFWLFAGWGLTFFAIDDYFSIHERLGDWLAGNGLLPNLLTNNMDDVIILGYAVAAVAGVYLFRHELLARRPSSALLAVGVVAAALMVGVDLYAVGPLKPLEFPVQVSAVALLFLAFMIRYR